MTIPALLAATVDEHGDRTAIVDGDTTLTWAQLQHEAGRFAAALGAAGVGRGDRVAIWHPNTVEWVVAVLGLWHAGAVLVPVNTRFKGAEAADILRRGHARLLLTTRSFLGTDYVGLLDGEDLPDLDKTWTTEAWEGLLPPAPVAGADVGPDDPADILFTSGTTGAPKGVVQTHARTIGVAADWVRMTGLGADDRYLMVNPYFHMFGLKAGILACVASGATMLPQRMFDVDVLLRRVAAERVTVLPGAPTLYQSILDHPGRGDHDLSSLRVAVTGAADIPVELIRRVRAELPFAVVLTGYGLTEAGTASATAPDDDPGTVATTVGRPRPGFELRIVEGEVQLRGPTVMAGYLDDPESTAAALSSDGWLRTGDLGELDEQGCLRIVGRAKDMFIVGGFNAYPAEIENALLRHSEVQQAAVVGIPDERLGEVGMAFVVTRSGDPAAGPGILAWAKEQMANYKVPRAIEVVDALPVNATGKVVKAELRARARPFLRFGDDQWTSGELDRQAGLLARHLRDAGVGDGDRVAVMLTNRPEFVVAVRAVHCLGAAAVLLSPAWKAAEVGHAVALTKPVHAVADGPSVGVVAEHLPVTDVDAVELPTDGVDAIGVDPEAEAVLVFSSGTTGLPKAVRHTHASLAVATRHWVDALGLTAADRFQVATPPSHILGLLNLLAAAEAGATVRLHARFDLDEVLRRIESDRITIEMAVAPIALAMAKHPRLEDFDLSSLRYIMWGATPVTETVARTVTERTGVRFLPAYGASELPVIACNPVGEPARWRLDSAGLPPDGVELRVVDLDTGAALAPGAVGEIQALSPSVMAGYLPDEANAEAFDDGWYRTGDVGFVEPDGWVHLTDRSKEMIKVKGFQVAPAEVEAVLHGHPSVLDCAVFGVPDEQAGEVPVAAVQLDPANPVDPSVLHALVADTLATYKQLHRVHVVDAIPRLPSGKVLRRVLRQQLS